MESRPAYQIGGSIDSGMNALSSFHSGVRQVIVGGNVLSGFILLAPVWFECQDSRPAGVACGLGLPLKMQGPVNSVRALMFGPISVV